MFPGIIVTHFDTQRVNRRRTAQVLKWELGLRLISFGLMETDKIEEIRAETNSKKLNIWDLYRQRV